MVTRSCPYLKSGSATLLGLGILICAAVRIMPRCALGEYGPTSRSERLQRLFSTFPSRWPGVGLLLLRATTGVTAAVQAGLYLSTTVRPTVGIWLVGLAVIACGVSLAIGWLTPGCSTAIGLGYAAVAFSRFQTVDSAIFLDWLAALFGLIAALAIALVGPGAFSLDAHLFGRREIVIPHRVPPRA
jgi:putative oxidoreductase